ncbi:transient receptor potential cation channel protein painless isoform X2 [Uranotaenia lowii]|uniref:transient receptor potential cation channel protein painless isoform X2 n=1 Tax=Uranotaenia lowii TaxID=190385 RepID=UPI0024793E6D|nr:transient receptor potential cation channel protein painless isoform X2 [Uranotaenia lowii]
MIRSFSVGIHIRLESCAVCRNVTGKHPLHFAISSFDPENLRTLLDHDKFNVDVTYQDQTALHILLDRIDDLNWKKIFSCVKLLLQAGANINIPNEDNRSALGVFAKNSKNWTQKNEYWRKDVLEYCLNNTEVDVDSFRKGELRKKINDFFPDTIIPHRIMKNNLSTLLALIKSQNETKFNSAYEQYSGIQKDEAGWQHEWKELLKNSVQSGRLNFVKKVLEYDQIFKNYEDLSELLSTCCSFGFYDILSFLLSKIENIESNIKQINKAPLLCLAIKEINTLKEKSKCPFFKCLEILLSDGRIDIDKTDDKGCSALHYAVKYKVDAAVDILLQYKAYIGSQNMFSELPICEMSTELLEKYLDSCITANDKRPGDDDYEITIDFSCLVPPMYKKNYSSTNEQVTSKCPDEMLPIVYMANSTDMKHLLKHPVISSFVLIKWLKLSLYFYINLLICTIFFISFTWYVVGCYGQEDVNIWLKNIVHSISFIGVTYMALREVGQMILHTKTYFTSVENWMEIMLILCSYTVLSREFSNEIRLFISAFVILLSAVEFTLLVGTLPVLSISTHMVMLKTVSKSFLKSLVLYSIILVSFAFCFYTLFNVDNIKLRNDDDNPTNPEEEFNTFGNIRTALLKTAVMLTGEFEAANINFRANSVSYVIFVLFLFFGAIVIFNLMNGLAVSDTTAIKAEAELIGLSQKVDVIAKYEQALSTSKSDGAIIRGIFSIFPSTFLKLFPKYIPQFFITVMPNQSNAILIPQKQRCVDGDTTVDVESHIELLPVGSKFYDKVKITVGCCVLPAFSRMDTKIMKYAREILHSRNKRSHVVSQVEPLEDRLSRMESNIEKILQCLQELK